MKATATSAIIPIVLFFVIGVSVIFPMTAAARGTETAESKSSPITVLIDIGKEFADVPNVGNALPDGYIVKTPPNGTIQLPNVETKDGYSFVGWSTGGVKDPDWTSDVKEISVSEQEGKNNAANVYALYSDSDGNGYCSCGDYEAGYYAGTEYQEKASSPKGETDYTVNENWITAMPKDNVSSLYFNLFSKPESIFNVSEHPENALLLAVMIGFPIGIIVCFAAKDIRNSKERKKGAEENKESDSDASDGTGNTQ